MNKIMDLIQELKEKGDDRWKDLELMVAKVDNITLLTPLGRLNATHGSEDSELWITLTTEDGEELAVSHFSVEALPHEDADIISRHWIGSQDDCTERISHEIMKQLDVDI